MRKKIETILLGFVFLLFLLLGYIENTIIFRYAYKIILSDKILGLLEIFLHNVIVVSIIIIGMSFYVRVVDFLPRREFEYMVLEHPKIFALFFTIIFFSISIIRTTNILKVNLINALLFIIFSLPHGILEFYSIFLAIKITLEKNLSINKLIIIYFILLISAILELFLIYYTKPSLILK
ncbi:MAG: hypothetical protein QXF09_04240 [Nitrososphaerota archaeon]